MRQSLDGVRGELTVFTSDQLKQLAAPLDKSRVSKRSDGGRQLSYLEGYDIIDTCNRIFGYGMWERGCISVIKFTEQALKRWVGQGNDRQEKDRYDAHVVVTGSVIVHGQDGQSRTHHDVGYGNGNSYTGFAESYELAYKEAVTDMLKRCLRVYGNQFGNSLYDKDGDDHKPAKPQAQRPANPPAPPASTPAPAPPAPAAQPAPQNPEAIIGKAEVATLLSIAAEKKWTNEAAAMLLKRHGYASSKVVKHKDFAAICAELNKGPAPFESGNTPAPPTPDELRQRIDNMVGEMANWDGEVFAGILESLTAFNSSDGQSVAGVRTTAALSDKRVPPSYGKVKAEYQVWQARRQEVAS